MIGQIVKNRKQDTIGDSFGFSYAQQEKLKKEVKKEILDSLKNKLSLEVENYMDYDCSEGETKLKVSLLLDGERISWEEVKVG